VACLLAGLTLNPSKTYGNGMVLVPGSDGAFQFREQSSGFARHFGSGGQPIIPRTTPSAPIPENTMSLLATPDSGFRAPRAISGSEEVLNAIDQTAVRYGGHVALRKAGMSLMEWRNFYRANIEIESAYNPRARSHVGAIGLGQLMPATAAKLGVDPHDMHQNLDGSARYLLMLLNRFGSKELALAGYNAGPGAVEQHGGIPPYRETQGHVRKVMAVFHRLTIATAE
jgi:soluble lytic murein transglycosylase-like protein